MRGRSILKRDFIPVTLLPHLTAVKGPHMTTAHNNTQASPQHSPSVKTEKILVVPRALLVGKGLLSQGFSTGSVSQNVAAVEKLVREHAQYHPRYLMEENESFKQIIPYFVFMHDKKLFLMQRSAKAGEARLASKYTLGIGGHVRKADLEGADIAAWGMREFEEEVAYEGGKSLVPLGLLNDDSNAVGRVHLGVVYLVHGQSSDIAIRSELQSGLLASREECDAIRDNMEGWSQMVYDALVSGGYL